MRKVLKIFGILFGVIILAVVGVVLFFDFDQVLNEQKDKYLPEVEKLLGRKVEVGEIKTTFLPILGAEIKAVQVAGRAEGEDPLMKIGSIGLQVDLWSAVKSFGKDVQLKGLVIDGLEVSLIREPDGTLSYQDVLDRLADGPPPEEEAPKPLDPEAIEFIQNLKLARIALQNSKFRLIDRTVPGAAAETSISDLLVEMKDVALKDPFEIKVAAGVFAEKQNFEVKVKLGPVPIGQPDGVLPIDQVTLKADGIDLAGILPYLGEDMPVKLKQAGFTADLTIDDPTAAEGHIKVDGSLSVAPLALDGPTPGQPFNLTIAPVVNVDPAAGIVDLTGFSIALDDMKITATGRLEGLNEGQPQFKGMKVISEKFHLGRLTKMVPLITANAPPGTVIDGPVVIDIKADGDPSAQQIDALIGLDAATLVVPGNLNKPSGVAFNTRVQADLKPDDLNLKQFDFNIGDLALKLSGTVKNFAEPVVNITGGTGKFSINGPARLSPAVAAAIPPDVNIAGQAEIDVKLASAPGNVDAHVLVGIYNADLDVPGATVKGSGKIELNAKGDPAKSLGARLTAGLGGLALAAGDAFNKPAGAPFDINVALTQGGKTINISEMKLAFGPLNMAGSGKVVTGGPMNFNASIQKFSMAEVARMVPALKESPIAKAKLGMDLAFSGNPAQPATVVADMKNFYFAQGRSSLTGDLTVKNLDAPNVRFAFNSPNLDLDQMFPPGPEGAEGAPPPAEEGGAGGAPDPMLKKIDAAGSLNIAKGRAGGFPFTKFIASLTMKNGVVKFSKLDFNSYGGTFSAAPTEANIGDAVPAFKANIAMRNVNAKPLLAEQADMKGTLSGRMTSTISVTGKGAAWEQISQNLSGSLGMSMKDGKLDSLDLEKQIISPLAKQIPLFSAKSTRSGTTVKNLAGKFSIADGKMLLKEPMTLGTPQGPLELDGAIGLDQSLALTGTLQLSPSALEKASKGKIKPTKPVPVGLRIGGTLTKPKIEGIDVAALAKALGPDVAKAMGLAKVLEAKEKAEALARQKAAEAKALARQKAAQAKAKAQQAANKAKAEAMKRKKQAEARARAEKKKAEKKAKDKAKKEAKKKLKGLF